MGPRRAAVACVRAAVLLGGVLDVPGLRRAVRGFAGRPSSTLEELGGVAAEVVRPGRGGGPWPAWVFVNGAHPERREEPVVRQLVEGLARAGYVVYVPDPQGLGAGTITPLTLEDVVAATAAALARPETRDGRVALIGASTGASLALLAAAREELAASLSVVVAVTPFADLRRIVCLATTEAYEEDAGFARYPVLELLRETAARSLLAAGEGDERVRALLANDRPERFDELWRALPDTVRETARTLSPLEAAEAVRAPVELVVPPRDDYFPPGEALALARALPRARLTATPTLDHTRPQADLRRLGGFVPFARFVVRGLAASG